VLPREQAVARVDDELSGMPAGAEPAAKLVHTEAPDAVPLHLPPGRLVWVVMFEVTPSGELGITVFDATTGESIFSGGLSAEILGPSRRPRSMRLSLANPSGTSVGITEVPIAEGTSRPVLPIRSGVVWY
jgi:hypothetical protein